MQYDFPKQEDVIQFVIEAIQAEAFNPKTLFLIGSYTVGSALLYLLLSSFQFQFATAMKNFTILLVQLFEVSVANPYQKEGKCFLHISFIRGVFCWWDLFNWCLNRIPDSEVWIILHVMFMSDSSICMAQLFKCP